MMSLHDALQDQGLVLTDCFMFMIHFSEVSQWDGVLLVRPPWKRNVIDISKFTRPVLDHVEFVSRWVGAMDLFAWLLLPWRWIGKFTIFHSCVEAPPDSATIPASGAPRAH